MALWLVNNDWQRRWGHPDFGGRAAHELAVGTNIHRGIGGYPQVRRTEVLDCAKLDMCSPVKRVQEGGYPDSRDVADEANVE